jgi:hypothetical protein
MVDGDQDGGVDAVEHHIIPSLPYVPNMVVMIAD